MPKGRGGSKDAFYMAYYMVCCVLTSMSIPFDNLVFFNYYLIRKFHPLRSNVFFFVVYISKLFRFIGYMFKSLYF